MHGDFCCKRLLPLSDLEVEVGPLTLRQSMLARQRARSTPPPDGFTAGEWEAVHAMALKIRRIGVREGITADELLDLADADTAAIQEAIQEVSTRENRFRRPAPAPAVGDGAGGEGDRVEPDGPAGAA